jgi:hypothetical protein
MALPTNIDSSYADDGGDASVALHQQHHDDLHGRYNHAFDVNSYGADPTGVADSKTAIQAAIDDAYTIRSGSQRGGVVLFDNGIYKCNTGLTLREGVTLQGVGMLGNNETRGTIVRCGATSITLMTLDGVSSNLQSGCTIRDMTLDGNSLATTTLLKFRLANRCKLYNVTFQLAGTQGLLLDAASDSVAGGDCAWHDYYNLHFYRCPIGIFSRESYRVNIFGADFIGFTSDTTSTHIKLGDSANASLITQYFCGYGIKYDEGLVHEDLQNAGFSLFVGSAHENGITAVKIRKPGGAGSISARGNQFIGTGVGNMTNGFDFGAGADQNTILGVANVSVTNPFIDTDGKTIYVPDFDRGAARFPAGVSTRHMAGTTPTGGVSGEVRVGTNKIWVNDAGTWKSATVA